MVKDVHGKKVKLFGILLAIVSGLFFVSVVVTPVLLVFTEKMLTESLDLIKEVEVSNQETGKGHMDYMDYCKTSIVESKEQIEQEQATILGIQADIERYKGFIEREKRNIESRKVKLKETQDEQKEYKVEFENAKAEVESADSESKVYEVLVAAHKDHQRYYGTLEKRCADIEKSLLKSKEDIDKYEKKILRYAERIKKERELISTYQKRISIHEESLRRDEESQDKQSSDTPQEAKLSTDELEQLLASRNQRIYSPMFMGVLLFHCMSMLLFFIIAKSWIAKDPFSKRVVISFRLLGILWIGHAIFTFGYAMMMVLRPDKLATMNRIPADLPTLPEFGNINSLIAGLLFLCLSYIMEHGSQMREDNSLTV